MKIVRFNSDGYCQFIYFSWREFKFKKTCWAQSIDKLFGRSIRNRKHLIIGLWNYGGTCKQK